VAVVQLGTFLVMLAIVLPVALAVRGTLEPDLLLLPVVVLLLFALVLGLSLAVAVLQAHFRDVEPVLTAALLPWFFATPIYLPVEKIPGVADHQLIGDLLEWGNPIAPFLDAVRELLYAGAAPGLGHLAYLVAVGGGALVLGVVVFRRMQRDLAIVL
jgi:ABC-type polysaccharide/polyol phosphate export permease